MYGAVAALLKSVGCGLKRRYDLIGSLAASKPDKTGLLLFADAELEENNLFVVRVLLMEENKLEKEEVVAVLEAEI